MSGLYNNLRAQIKQLSNDVKKLQEDLQQQKDSSIASKPVSYITDPELVSSQTASITTVSSALNSTAVPALQSLSESSAPTPLIEPDERSLPIVTSYLTRLKIGS